MLLSTATVLGRIGLTAVPGLETLVLDQNPGVREAAARTLARLDAGIQPTLERVQGRHERVYPPVVYTRNHRCQAMDEIL